MYRSVCVYVSKCVCVCLLRCVCIEVSVCVRHTCEAFFSFIKRPEDEGAVWCHGENEIHSQRQPR